MGYTPVRTADQIADLQAWARQSSANPKLLLQEQLAAYENQHRCNAMSDDRYYTNGRHEAMERTIYVIKKALETI